MEGGRKDVAEVGRRRVSSVGVSTRWVWVLLFLNTGSIDVLVPADRRRRRLEELKGRHKFVCEGLVGDRVLTLSVPGYRTGRGGSLRRLYPIVCPTVTPGFSTDHREKRVKVKEERRSVTPRRGHTEDMWIERQTQMKVLLWWVLWSQGELGIWVVYNEVLS